MLTVPQRHRRTETDGRTTYDSNTALCTRASRGKKPASNAYIDESIYRLTPKKLQNFVFWWFYVRLGLVYNI